MKLGAVFPQSELGADVAQIRDYAQALEGLGYDFFVTSDHVVGSEAAAHPDLPRVFSIDSVVREPFALFAYVAGVAPKLGFLPSVVILPQRQATLVAKQAAEVDVLSGGRLRLGVGIGWNPVEFEALGMPFRNRARRFEEQIDVIRRLTSERLVTFEGRYHTLRAAGINPRPVQRPIPIWIGAHSEVAVQRATRIADGYLPLRPFEGGWDATIEKVHGWLRAAGRDPAAFGIEGRLDAGGASPEEWRATVQMWRRFGASHLSVSTGGVSLGGPDAHARRLRDVLAVVRAA